MHIALVLGAGASLANAQHFKRERGLDMHPPLDTTFFQKLRIREVPLDPALRRYVRQLTGSEPSPATLERMRMEEFFKDLYYDFQDNPEDRQLRRAYIELVSVYTRVLRETTNWLCQDSRQGAPIGKVIAAAAEVADEVSILTFNHDLIIENEIYKRARLRQRWCLERGYGAISAGMTMLRSGTTTDFPRHSDDCDHGRPITVYKLHGSLNWIFRLRGRDPSARQLTGRGPAPELLLSRRREIIGRLRYSSGRVGRGRSSWHTWPLIIPPIYAKQAFIHYVDPVWADARAALRTCDQVVFFGYSLPLPDIEAEKLFQRTASANVEITAVDVVNPDPASAARYASLVPKKPLHWYPDIDRFLATSPIFGA